MEGGFNSIITVNNDPNQCYFTTAQLLTNLGIVPTAIDNCSVDLLPVTVSPATIPVSAGPMHTPSEVTWTATDKVGNKVTVKQKVIVQDIELPVMRTKNILKYFDQNGQITILPEDIDDGSTDNSGTLCFTKVVVPNILYCSNKGDNSVVLTGTDLWGNRHDKVAIVTAIDNIKPTITAPSDVTLNTNTGCAWVGSLALPRTADNCSVGYPAGVRSDALPLTAPFPLGTTTVTWTVTDASGNDANPTTTSVNVNDGTGPTVVTKDIGLVLDHGSVSILPSDVFVSATDACGVDTSSYSLDKSTFTITDVRDSPVTIYLTVKDIYGNSTLTPVKVTFPNQIIDSQVITPNGDGINDIWYVENITNHPNSIIRVFNRWGSLVYSAKNYQNDWDGKLNGSDAALPDGSSYYYQIDLEGIGKVDYEGWLYISSQ